MRLTIVLFVLCAALGLASGSAHAERRLAFVAGIDRYEALPADAQLERAVRDAGTVADTLTGLGFSVTRLTDDVNQANFLRAFGNFVDGLKPDDVVLFYFSGHGVGLDGQNYLIPADIPKLQADDQRLLKLRALAETDLIDDIRKQGVRVAIMVIDACRNNPFPREGRKSLGLTKGFERLDSPDGVLSIYAAGAGQEALDHLDGVDTDQNSVFTRVFVKYLKQPGLSLSELGDSVRDDVAALSHRQQVPGVYGQIIGQRKIFLAGLLADAGGDRGLARTDAGSAPMGAAPAGAATTTGVTPVGPPAEDPEIAYNKAVLDNTKEGYEALLKRFPNHPKKDVILNLYQMKTEEAVWRSIEAAADPAEKLALVRQLLKVFPKGVFAERAGALEAKLVRDEASVAPPPVPDAPTPSPPVDVAQRDFDAAEAVNTTEAWNGFLVQHPGGTLAELARFKLREAITAARSAASSPLPTADPAPRTADPAARIRLVPGYDAPGNDRSGFIRGVAGADACQATCTADTGCGGFVYNIRRRVCILKNAIGPLVPAPEPAVTGIVEGRLQSPSGPPAARFRTFENLDAEGNDLRGFVKAASVADCEGICASTPSCEGYTFNRQRLVCIPKNRIGRLVKAPEPAVTGILVGRQ